MTDTTITNVLSKEQLFNETINKYEKLITKFVYKFNIPNYSKDDIQQEIHMKLWELLDSYDENRAAFITFFYRSIHNHLLALTYINKQDTYLDTDVYDLDRQDMFATDENIERADRQQVISDMIWDYLAKHRYGKIMRWHYIGKMSIKRIAEIEKRTINTIQQRFYRTYDDIRKDLGIDNLRDYFE
jgi:RNA polymerase sigma factor (sigma-70 family)